MTDVAVRVENLGKKYSLGGQKSGSFRESISNLFRKRDNGNSKPVTGLQSSDSEFWALKDINFEIKKGEADWASPTTRPGRHYWKERGVKAC